MDESCFDLQICFCSCSGVSASALEISRKQATTARCKTCGGKPFVNGRELSSTSMPGAVGLELTRFVNSDLTWTRITKGSRSSSRRARKSLTRSLKNIAEQVNKEHKVVDMPVSESEKLGVSVLGCRFSERAEHVPIKKRRFLFRSPSPPPTVPAPCSEKSGLLLKPKSDLHQELHNKLLDKSQSFVTKADASISHLDRTLDTKLDIDVKNLVRENDKIDETEDFSGISILAAAACSNCTGEDDDHAELGSGMEESIMHEAAFEGSNNESCSLSKGISKEDSSYAEISREGTGSCVSIVPVEVAVSSRTGNSPKKCVPEDTLMEDHSMTTSKDLSSKKDDETVGLQESSSRDDRLHWDLNTVMDAWEQPFDQCSNSQNTAVVSNLDYRNSACSDRMGSSDELPGENESTKVQPQRETLSIYLRDRVHKMQQSNIEEIGLDACADTERSICLHKGLPSESDYATTLDSVQGKKSLDCQEVPISLSTDLVPADVAAGGQTSAFANRSASAQSVPSGSTGSSESLSVHQVGRSDICSEGNVNGAAFGPTGMKGVDGDAAGVQTSEVTSSSTQVERQAIALHPTVFCTQATGESGDIGDHGTDSAEGASALDNGIVRTNLVGLEISQPPEFGTLDNVMRNCSSKLDQVSLSQSPHMCTETPTSVTPIGGQPAGIVAMSMQEGKVSCQYNAESGAGMPYSGEEAKSLEKCMAFLHSPSRDACPGSSDDLVNISDKVAPEEPLEKSNSSDVCHNDHFIGVEELSEHGVDYDSQYEDGEVRDRLHAWEDYCGDDDEETEHVDYGSENTNTLGCEGDEIMKNTQESSFQPHPNGSLLTEVTTTGSEMEGALTGMLTRQDANNVIGKNDDVDRKPGVSASKVTRNNETDARGEDTRKTLQSICLDMKMSARDQSMECHKNPLDVATGVRDSSSWKNTDGDCVDELDAEDTDARIAEPGMFNRDLRLHIEGRTSRNMHFGKDKLTVQGSRYTDADDSNPRFRRELGSLESFGRGGYSRHSHNRGQRGDGWVDSSENHRTLKRNHSPGYHGPMTLRQPGSENSVHRTFRRNGSPVRRYEVLGMRLGGRPTRDVSPYRRLTRGRGRSIRYSPLVDGRGTRGRYHGPLPGSFRESSFNHSHPSVRRDRSFSPTERRLNTHAHQSCTRSPSRSRTRSPIGGTAGFRYRSKSPNFRSGVGMQRLRSPHQRPGFLPDHIPSFRSTRRVRDSPTHDSRWIADRRDEASHFREHGYNQRARYDRFDILDAPRSYRSTHLGPLSEMDGVGRACLRDVDRRKDGYKYRSGNLESCTNTDGPIKRIRYDVDFVAARNSRYQDGADFRGRWDPKDYSSRGIGGQIGDGPRRSVVGAPHGYQRDGKYDVKSNSSAMREVEGDSSPRKRPS